MKKAVAKKVKPTRHAILETNKKTGKKLLYSTLKKYIEIHPQYNWETVTYHISRKKTPFEDDRIILERLHFWD
jgi:hypothetical protein